MGLSPPPTTTRTGSQQQDAHKVTESIIIGRPADEAGEKLTRHLVQAYTNSEGD